MANFTVKSGSESGSSSIGPFQESECHACFVAGPPFFFQLHFLFDHIGQEYAHDFENLTNFSIFSEFK